MQCLEAFISIGTAFDGRLIAIPRNQLFAFAHLNQATNPPAGAAYPNPRRTDMDKATPTPSPASVDKQAALVAKLRYMGKQYAAGQVARGGSPQKHYLEEAADEIEMMAWALSMNTKTPASAQENADLRNVIQAACIDGLPGLSRAWEKYFPDHPITIKGAEVERLAAQSAPTSKMACEQIRAWHDAYPRMDIYAKPGTLVMFDGRGGYEGEQEAAKKLLTMRGVYAVERVDVFSSSSTVYLAGVKGRGFNTVMFSVAPEPVAAQSPLK
jgi:hypothetical protein